MGAVGGSINFTVGGHTQGLTCTRTQGNGSDFIGAWVESTSLSWSFLGMYRMAVACPYDMETDGGDFK